MTDKLKTPVNSIRMLAQVGYELYSSHLVGVTCGSMERRINRMRNPQVGDVVVETSTSGWWRTGIPAPLPHIKAENAIGFLEKIAQEPYDRDEPWDEEKEGMPEPVHKVWYLRLLHDDTSFRWVNADCVTILPVEGWVD